MASSLSAYYLLPNRLVAHHDSDLRLLPVINPVSDVGKADMGCEGITVRRGVKLRTATVNGVGMACTLGLALKNLTQATRGLSKRYKKRYGTSTFKPPSTTPP